MVCERLSEATHFALTTSIAQVVLKALVALPYTLTTPFVARNFHPSSDIGEGKLHGYVAVGTQRIVDEAHGLMCAPHVKGFCED